MITGPPVRTPTPLCYSVDEAMHEVRETVLHLGLPIKCFVRASCSMNMATALDVRVRAEMGGSARLFPQTDIGPLFDYDTIYVSIPADPMDNPRPKLPTGGTGLMCGHCSQYHLGACLRVLEIEYFPSGAIRFVKYHPDWIPPAETARADRKAA